MVFHAMRIVFPVSFMLVAACTAETPVNNQATQNSLVTVNADQRPGDAPAPAEPMTPPAASPNRAPVAEAPFTATSAQGAANVVQTYYAHLEARNYVEAHKLWGPSSDLADATFADQFNRYREYHAEVFAPGSIEGAAGSLYVEVPVRTYGVTTRGERFEQPGVVTLRRVNDVPGSSAEQRRWHIAKIDLPPH